MKDLRYTVSLTGTLEWTNELEGRAKDRLEFYSKSLLLSTATMEECREEIAYEELAHRFRDNGYADVEEWDGEWV